MISIRRKLMARSASAPAPEGYEYLEYIQKQGTNAYINVTGGLNIALMIGDIVDLKILFVQQMTGYQCFMGWTGEWEVHVENMVFGTWYGLRQTSLAGRTASLGVLYNPMYTVNDARGENGLLLGTYKAGSNGYPVYARFYGLSISRDGNRLANLIPAKRTADGAVGVYDTVQGIFLTSLATSFEEPQT